MELIVHDGILIENLVERMDMIGHSTVCNEN